MAEQDLFRSLKGAAVGGVDLADGPPWLDYFASAMHHSIDDARRSAPKHRCEKCTTPEGRRGTNYSYEPTPEDIADPTYWVVFPGTTETPPFLGAKLHPVTTYMRRSRFDKLPPGTAYVLYKTYFFPCAWSFDFQSLNSLSNWAAKTLRTPEYVVAHLDQECYKVGRRKLLSTQLIEIVISGEVGSYRLHSSYGPGLYQLPGIGTVNKDQLDALVESVEDAVAFCEEGGNDINYALAYYGLGPIKLNWLAPEEISQT